jgi:hypothetical protein
VKGQSEDVAEKLNGDLLLFEIFSDVLVENPSPSTFIKI